MPPFVATASSPYHEGEIILIDENIYGEKEEEQKWIQKLAKDFEQFLIVVGNINQIHRTVSKKDDDRKAQEQELLKRLHVLEVSEEYHRV